MSPDFWYSRFRLGPTGYPVIAPGYCQCGCGAKTTIAPETSSGFGWAAGWPRFYVFGHVNRLKVPYLIEAGTDCWIWQGGRGSGDYGRLARKGQLHQAHKFFYEQQYGPVTDGLDLDHLCRNPLCVNPDHLEPVSHATNTRRGYSARLTEETVREIRSSRRVGMTTRTLAEKFGVSKNCINDAVSGRRWGDVV
jgi:hypothetical protein